MPLLTGCPDVEGRYNEFIARVPDAKTVVTIDAPPLNEIPDISGTFLLGISINVLAALPPIQALATVVMTPNGTGATASFHIVLLDKTTREPIASTALDVNDVAISRGGEMDLMVATLTIPVEANPGGLPATATNLDLHGLIQNKDFFCGSVTGMVPALSLDLAGSTFASVRKTGSDLPAPVKSCAAPDGGM